MNQNFAEMFNACSGFIPVALNTNPGSVSDWFSLRDYGRAIFIFQKAVGTNGDDPTLTLTQATAVAGTSPKAINITDVWKKQAATNLFAVGTYTHSTSASPALHDTFSTNTWTNSDLAEQAAIVIIEVKAEDLDADNGYDCVNLQVSDVGTNAQLGTLLVLLGEPRYQKDPLNSGIID